MASSSFSNKKPTSTAAAAATTAVDIFFAASSLLPSLLTSPIHPPSSPPLLRRFCLFILSTLLHLFDLILSLLFPPPPSSSSHTSNSNSLSSSLPTARALSHVLSVVSFTPVSSQKYYFVRSLADRLLDENIGFEEVNRVALLDAFGKRIRGLEAAVARCGGGGNGIWGVFRWVGGGEMEGGGGSVAAEKLAGEVLWIAQKMGECGAGGEAVARWAAAVELGRSALFVEARIQVAFVRVSGKKRS